MPAWINVRFPRPPYRSMLLATVKPQQSQLVRYGVAVVAVLLGLTLMLLLNPWVPMTGSPFLVFFASVMVSAWYGGLGPGVWAIILSTLAAKYYFIPPRSLWQFEQLADVARLGIFIVVAVMVTALSAARRQWVSDLQTDRDLVSAVVSTAGSLILVLDRQGRIVEFNRACEEATGYTFDEVLGKQPWRLFLPVDEVDLAEEAFQKLRAGIFPGEYEGTWITRTGDRRFIAWSNTVLLDDRRFVRFVVCTGNDLTERKQAEKALQATNQTLQALIQSSPLSIIVLDRSGCVKLWNPVSEQIFGWSQAEVQGQRLPIIPPDKQVEFEANLATALRGETLHGVEIRRQRKDGSPIDIGLWTAILPGSRTQEDSVMAIMIDLSDRKRAEAALKLSQERLTRFFEGNVIGIVFADFQGGIEQANDEFLRLVGYSRRDLETGLSWKEMTPPEFLEVDAAHIAEARNRGACTPYEKEYFHKNGARVPVLIGFALLEEDRSQAIAFVLDLTDRKQMERTLRHQAEELAQANRMKDEFLAVLSHELRTPLNSMLGWSRLLRSRQLDESTTARALETIERNARLQAQLIEDILDVSKLIRGKLRLKPQAAKLEPVMEAAIDAMSPAAAAKGVELSWVVDPAMGTVLGDPDRLQQVFWNLISNAIKFTPEGGRVEIRLEPVGEREKAPMSQPPPRPPAFAQVTITDTGKGISADFLPFVFDRFRQADSSITRADGGLGLGLAIVRHLVEMHGGSVWAESPGLGLGATFTVRLPLLGDRPVKLPSEMFSQRSAEEIYAAVNSELSSTQPYSADSLAIKPFSSSLLKGLHILLVDDEADTRDVLRAELEQHGATVAIAGSAAEAFNLIVSTSDNNTPESWKPDILISDIVMPFEDGYSLIRKVRDLQASQGTFIPALALTALSTQEENELSVSAGFQMHLSKPVELIALVTAVASLTGRSATTNFDLLDES